MGTEEITPSANSATGWLDRIFLKLKRTTNSAFFLPQIDGLRFLAIALVVLIHINVFYLAKNPYVLNGSLNQYPLLYTFLYNGFKGVELFFVISGFILAMPFARHYLAKEQKVSLKAYFLRRLTRLEPPYMSAMLLIFALLILMGKYTPVQLFPGLLASLTYTHNFFNNLPWLNGVTWSLEIEIQFYILVPLLARIFSLKTKVRRAALLALIVLIPVVQTFFDPGVRTIYNYLQFFMVGFLLADLYLSGFKLRTPKLINFFLGVAALVVIIFLDFSDPYLGVVFKEPLFYKIIFPLTMLLFYILALTDDWWKKLFGNRVLTSIGGMCYTIYLWHEIIISAIGNKLVRLKVSDYFLPNFLLQTLILSVVVVLVSAVLYVLIEKPTMDKNWPKKVYNFFRLKFFKTPAI